MKESLAKDVILSSASNGLLNDIKIGASHTPN